MKKILILTIFATIILSSYAFAASPVLFYSDLTSGPKTGGQDNKGAFVTVYGKNFGSSQGASYVSIGGGQADNYPVWSDTKISFQLGSAAVTGNITVTTSEGTSNGVPFTVRSGNIYFVDINVVGPGTGTYADPWKSPASYYAALPGQDGATCYFRAGTYSGEYGRAGWHSNFCLAADQGASGADGSPNAFVGYPGETALFYANSGSDPTMGFRNHSAQYIVISNLSCTARSLAIGAGSHWRVVGNIVNGLHVLSGAGIIMVGPTAAEADNIKIYGNEITGGTSGNKLDHAIYTKPGTNIDIGWNWIHDNNFAAGPMISNNDDGAHSAGRNFSGHLIHDNLIDMSDHPSRAIGIADVGDASTFYIYNNVIIGPSTSDPWNPVLYAWYGTVNYLNNTIYNCGNNSTDNDIFWMNTGVTAATFQNNIVYANATCAEYMDIDGGVITNTNNCWYGIGSFATHSAGTTGTNANAVEADPLFVSASTGDFHLNTGSPCIDAGADVSSVVATDKDGNSRAVNDIGAYEYDSGQSGPLLGDLNSDNQVNIQDVQACVNHILGTQDWGARADVNSDGSVNILDAQRIANIILGE